MVTITTAITQLTDEGPIYRGRRATELAASWSFEEVAEWLWETPQPDDDGATAAPGGWQPYPLGLPPDIGPAGRMRWATVMAGAPDPLRADLRPEAVTRAARRLAASMVAVVAGETVPEDGASQPSGSSLMAARLASALSSSPTPEQVRAVNAALVLMADHELATSTMAVRMAASTRADIYDAAAGRTRHHRRTTARGSEPFGLLLAGRRRAVRRSAGPGRDLALAGRASWLRSLGIQERGRPRRGAVRAVRVDGRPRPDRSGAVGHRSGPRPHPSPCPTWTWPWRPSRGRPACRRKRVRSCSPWPGWPVGWPTISKSSGSAPFATGPGLSMPPAG